MLSLNPGSVCDVCAEEYSPSYLPHCIPCGHVLCAACCTKIIEKTPPRLLPACPFCRLSFATEGIRKIRIDFASSGRSTPRAPLHATTIEAPPADAAFPRGVVKEDRLPPPEKDRMRMRATARWLEDRVARAAATKTSVEEVAMLQNEVDEWLRASDLGEEQPMSLRLSSALLRAILTNYNAHADLSKTMKSTEANLKAQIGELETAAGNLQVELRKLKAQQAQKAQECQSLRAELSRYKVKAAASTLGLPPTTSFGSAASSVADSRPTSPLSPASSDPRSAASSRATSPFSARSAYSPLVSPIPRVRTPLGSPAQSPPMSPSAPRYTSSAAHPSSSSSGRHRSSSISSASAAAPAPAAAPPARASASAYRSHTPAYPIVVERSETPTPPARSSSVRRPSISTHSSYGAHPSSAAPPKMLRSASDEERERAAHHHHPEKVHQPAASAPDKHRSLLHQRWLPGSTDPRAPSAPPPASRPAHTRSSSVSSKASTAYAALSTRLGTPLRA